MDEARKEYEIDIEQAILYFFKKHRAALFIFAILGAIIGFIGSLILPQEWPSTAVIQVGQYVEMNQDGTTRKYVEPAALTAARINSPGFQDQVLAVLKVTDPDSPEAVLVRRWLKGTVLSNEALVEVSARGQTPEDARKILQSTYDLVAAEHQKTFDAAERMLKQNLANTTAALSDDEVKRDAMNKTIQQNFVSGSTDKNFPENVLLNSTLRDTTSEINKLRDRQNQQESAADSANSFNTKFLTSITVARRPAFPEKIPFILVGLIAGFIIGIIFFSVAGLFRKS